MVGPGDVERPPPVDGDPLRRGRSGPAPAQSARRLADQGHPDAVRARSGTRRCRASASMGRSTARPACRRWPPRAAAARRDRPTAHSSPNRVNCGRSRPVTPASTVRTDPVRGSAPPQHRPPVGDRGEVGVGHRDRQRLDPAASLTQGPGTGLGCSVRRPTSSAARACRRHDVQLVDRRRAAPGRASGRMTSSGTSEVSGSLSGTAERLLVDGERHALDADGLLQRVDHLRRQQCPLRVVAAPSTLSLRAPRRCRR